jgi:Gpi18-like mannosyltransferase
MTETGASKRGLPLPDLDRIPPYVSIAIGAVGWVLLYAPHLSFSVSDFILHVKPWLDYLRDNGGFLALADDFSEYAPPYLYLLGAVSYFDFPFNDQVLVKLVNAPFVLATAAGVFLLCRHFGKSVNHAVAAGASVVLLPTLGVNAFVWGQADAIYGSLLLLSALLVIKGRPYWAVGLFAAAVSTKLQGMYLAPFILMMLLAGRIPWKAVVVAPLVYAGTLLPALLVGRPLIELLTVYLIQGKMYHRLSFNAANPYFILDFLFHASDSRFLYKIFTVLGLGFASVSGLAVSLVGFARTRMTDRAVLIAAALSVTVMPYVLPKMHDRYFMAADLLMLALAWVDRRFIWAAVALQVGSMLSYTPEFSIYALPGAYESWGWAVLAGMVINGFVIAHLVRELRAELGGLWDVEAMKSRLPAGLIKTS